MPEVTAWQNRPLETVYPFVFLDAIHYKVKENHQYQTKAAYVVLGITMDGTKDILGVWIGEHESSKFWLNVLNDLKSRGVLDVYLFCVDGLKGFVEAIGAVYPRSQVQRCIVHQIRSSTRFVSYKDIKPLMADLKKVYTAVTEDDALENLMAFKDKWGKQYPSCVKSWEDNWDILSTFFAYPTEIRKIIYTTNMVLPPGRARECPKDNCGESAGRIRNHLCADYSIIPLLFPVSSSILCYPVFTCGSNTIREYMALYWTRLYSLSLLSLTQDVGRGYDYVVVIQIQV